MSIPELFGINVFNDDSMQQYLPADVYASLQRTIAQGAVLDAHIAGQVADGMKNWAIERGATHFTHWFQPMTGITAEKHDSFLSIKNGKPILEFSGKELIKGEPDASSLPSGGIRATFEARGYTAWDPSSYAFVKDKTLCIPTAFCSFGGQALDKKTPLLRSMQALNKQAVRVLRLFGNKTVNRVTPTVGAEQEYFLVDSKLFNQREDLIITGRTLFGAKSPKGQELNDHYFGTIPQRVIEFMHELDEELWKLGVYAKTEHNETAPAQHELAPIFTTSNLAADQNQLTMAMMKQVARKHNMVCLLHEKPFANVNGSGKHNNWSLITDTGINLLEPGSSPAENAQFILFLVAVIKAVDEYQDLLRLSVASAGNDHRLGANEAPPAIMSIFLGDDLTAILEAFCRGNKMKTHKSTMHLGVDLLPDFQKDATDRNRTSPFAFTGNKFEFRMPGSEFSISEPNIVLNTCVAEVLKQFADELEKADDFNTSLNLLVARTVKKHKKILFSGNNYSTEWKEEAARRGLLNLASTDVAVPFLLNAKNVELFKRQEVFSLTELQSREEIMLTNYCQTIHIEAATMLDMAQKQIMPAIRKEMNDLSAFLINAPKLMAESAVNNTAQKHLFDTLVTLSSGFYTATERLKVLLSDCKADAAVSKEELSHVYRNNVLPAMKAVRDFADEAETIISKDAWPFPTYVDLLFSI